VDSVVVAIIAGLPWSLGRSPEAAVISSLPGARPLAPAFPALTCPAQATLTTGAPAARHGIVANGLFDRDYLRVSFWEQSGRLVQGTRVWQDLKARKPGFTTALLFLQNSIGAGVDAVVTPAPVHRADGSIVSSCYARPRGLYEELAAKLGPFDLAGYWGPMASIKSSRWIAAAAREVFLKLRPNLLFVYLPHLDYPLQRLGPDSPAIRDELKLVDSLVGEIRDWSRAGGAELVVLSDYAMTQVSGAVMPNRILREAGLLEVREVDGREYLDVAASAAFAMADHQVAHVYARAGAVAAARAALGGAPGIERILGGPEKAEYGIDHPRSGDLVLLSSTDRWFAYYWWHDDAKAPDFARTVDIHRKPGYDPCELFFDPAARAIPLDPSLVKGSHGLAPRPVCVQRTGRDEREMAFIAGPPAHRRDGEFSEAGGVAGYLSDLFTT